MIRGGTTARSELPKSGILIIHHIIKNKEKISSKKGQCFEERYKNIEGQ